MKRVEIKYDFTQKDKQKDFKGLKTNRIVMLPLAVQQTKCSTRAALLKLKGNSESGPRMLLVMGSEPGSSG